MTRFIKCITIASVVAGLFSGVDAQARTLQFSGYEWTVRDSGIGGPGPNNWDSNNAWVDGNGYLHLALTQNNGQWYCAEIYTSQALGYGRYQFWLDSRVDLLDQNVVLGLFHYPTPDVGPDGTNEIDIEFAKWGNPAAPIGNYTVWPSTTLLQNRSQSFPITLNSDWSTHRYTWSSSSVVFQSLQGHLNYNPKDDRRYQFAGWTYKPKTSKNYISQKPMPMHINLWSFQGQPPTNGQPVEIIISSFKFTPQ